MHRSGINVDAALKAEWAAVQKNADLLFVKIKIVNELFKKVEEGKAVGDAKASFAAIAATLKPADPCFILTRAGSKEAGKWTIIFYVPENAVVKEKTTYASSIAALKEGLGSGSFAAEFNISLPTECTAAAFESWNKDLKQEDMMTSDEVIRKEAVAAEGMARGVTKSQAMADVKVSVDAKLTQALSTLKNDSKHDTVIMQLNPNFDTLLLERAGTMSVDDLGKSMPAKEGRYAVHRFSHENEGKATVAYIFVYYCPEAAHPKTKMPYSTFKASAVRVAQATGVEVAKQYECSEGNEIKAEAFLLELYPRSADKKVFTKAKPKANKGKAGLIGKTKFSAAPVGGGSGGSAAAAAANAKN